METNTAAHSVRRMCCPVTCHYKLSQHRYCEAAITTQHLYCHVPITACHGNVHQAEHIYCPTDVVIPAPFILLN